MQFNYIDSTYFRYKAYKSSACYLGIERNNSNVILLSKEIVSKKVNIKITNCISFTFNSTTMPISRCNVIYRLVLLLSFLLTIVAQNCSNQGVINISAGEFHNTTIPSANCYQAELQYSDGDHRQISTSPAYCTGSNVPSNLSIGLRYDTPVGPLNLTVFCRNMAPTCYTFAIQSPQSQPNPLLTDSLNNTCQAASAPFPSGGSALALSGPSGSTPNMPQATAAFANVGSLKSNQTQLPGSAVSSEIPSSQQDRQASSIFSSTGISDQALPSSLGQTNNQDRQASSIFSSTAMSDQALPSSPGQTNNQDRHSTPMSSDQAGNQTPNSSPSEQQPKSQASQISSETPSASNPQSSGIPSESVCHCPCPSTSTSM